MNIIKLSLFSIAFTGFLTGTCAAMHQNTIRRSETDKHIVYTYNSIECDKSKTTGKCFCVFSLSPDHLERIKWDSNEEIFKKMEYLYNQELKKTASIQKK